MADPKYANLPGIAHDQPDVYETNDLPEADQDLKGGLIDGSGGDTEETSDAIETLHISANEAMGRFKGKYIDSGKVDFSDKIRGVGRKGYVVFSAGDYELVGRGEDETPLQKYQRLNCEVRELLDELEELKADDEAGGGEASTIKGVALQVDQLRNQLSNLQLDEILGSERIRSLEDPRGAAREKLMNQLASLNKSNVVPNKEPVRGGGDSNSSSMTYELYLKPEAAKMQEHLELAQLEKRLKNLERVIGTTNSDKISTLAFETNQKSILGAISVLSSRTYLLDPSHLDHVEGRLFALQQKLKEISERKTEIEDSEKMNRIAELYDLVQRNEGMAAALPEIVNRLEALENLHDHALQFSKTLKQLEGVQEKLVTTMANNQKLLNDTQKKITENFGSIQSNFQTVERRLEALTTTTKK